MARRKIGKRRKQAAIEDREERDRLVKLHKRKLQQSINQAWYTYQGGG